MDRTPRNPGQDPYADGASEAAVPQEAAFGAAPASPPPPPAAPDGTLPPLLPPHPAPGTPGGTRRPSLKSRGVAIAVAAALAAGLLGGVAGGWVGGEFGDDSASSSYTATGSAPVQSVADTSLTGVSAVAKAVLPSVVEISVTTRRGSSSGSGLVLSADGKILTNAHVVEGSDGGTVTVKFEDGRTAEATVVGTDTASDLAVIKVDGVDDLQPATLGDSDSVAVGDPVVAIGSPEGLTNTVTSGIVSALNREVTVPSSDSDQGSQLPFGGTYDSAAQSAGTTYHAIQTDASINPGNSGGPLLDMNGRVVGINSAIYSPTSGALGSDAGSVGLGFAIPINQVKSLLGDLESGSKA
ncbi:trypsin-like peptidase domain-containing protein [Streptomycetaceae bacterium NBC_01309]